MHFTPYNLLGVAHDAPVIINDQGGKQSVQGAAYELMPPLALEAVAFNLAYGAAKYGDWNWRSIPSTDHVRHTIGHMVAHVSQDTSDVTLPQYPEEVQHLIKAATRALFALDSALIEHRPKD